MPKCQSGGKQTRDLMGARQDAPVVYQNTALEPWEGHTHSSPLSLVRGLRLGSWVTQFIGIAKKPRVSCPIGLRCNRLSGLRDWRAGCMFWQ